MAKVYMARTNTCSSQYFKDALNYIQNSYPEHDVLYHNEYTEYDSSIEKQCDYFIYVHDSGYAGKGVYTQVEEAKKRGIDTVLFYKRRCDDTWHFYTFTMNKTENVKRAEKYNEVVDFRYYAFVDILTNISEEVYDELSTLEDNSNACEPYVQYDYLQFIERIWDLYPVKVIKKPKVVNKIPLGFDVQKELTQLIKEHNQWSI